MQHADKQATNWNSIVRRAVAEAIETHRRLGQSIVVWRDDKPTWIAPEDIPPLEDLKPQINTNVSANDVE